MGDTVLLAYVTHPDLLTIWPSTHLSLSAVYCYVVHVGVHRAMLKLVRCWLSRTPRFTSTRRTTSNSPTPPMTYYGSVFILAHPSPWGTKVLQWTCLYVCLSTWGVSSTSNLGGSGRPRGLKYVVLWNKTTKVYKVGQKR